MTKKSNVKSTHDSIKSCEIGSKIVNNKELDVCVEISQYEEEKEISSSGELLGENDPCFYLRTGENIHQSILIKKLCSYINKFWEFIFK